MKCAMCGSQIDLVEDAIEQGWVPSFYDEMDVQHEPACSNCVQLFLTAGVDGEWEIKEQYRGKLTYTDEQPPRHLMIGIAICEGPSEIH